MIISKSSYLLAAVGLVLLLPSCNHPRYPEDNNVFIRRDGPPRYGWRGTQNPQGDERKDPDDQKDNPANPRGEDPQNIHDEAKKPEKPEATDPPAEPSLKPDPDKPKPTGANLPFGTPVIGEKGYVYSPYAPDKGKVDVTGIPSNTKVECPYTGKIFRVP